MESPFALLYTAIIERLKTTLDKEHLRYIDWDLGQMESYNPGNGGKPRVSFPALLIDMENFNFEEEGELTQRATGIILMRLCFDPVSSTDSLTPGVNRANGLAYFEAEFKLNAALHGWSPGAQFGYLTRVSSSTEKREDTYRVRQVRYSLSFEDLSTMIPLLKADNDFKLDED